MKIFLTSLQPCGLQHLPVTCGGSSLVSSALQARSTVTRCFDFVQTWQGSLQKLRLLLVFTLKNGPVTPALYIHHRSHINLLKQSLIFPVIFCFSIHTPALTSQSSIKSVVSSLLSFYQTIRTCKVVSSQTCSDNEGLVPDDTTLYRRVLAHASLYHVATADSISSSSISMISTACRKFRTGCNFFQFPHSSSQLCLMWTPKS